MQIIIQIKRTVNIFTEHINGNFSYTSFVQDKEFFTIIRDLGAELRWHPKNIPHMINSDNGQQTDRYLVANFTFKCSMNRHRPTIYLLRDSQASFSHEDHSSFFFVSFTPRSMRGSSFFVFNKPDALAAEVLGALKWKQNKVKTLTEITQSYSSQLMQSRSSNTQSILKACYSLGASYQSCDSRSH